MAALRPTQLKQAVLTYTSVPVLSYYERDSNGKGWNKMKLVKVYGADRWRAFELIHSILR